MPMASANSITSKNRRRQRATAESKRTPIEKKSKEVSVARKSLRLRLRSQNKPPVFRTPQSQPIQQTPTRPTPVRQSAAAKRKRSQDLEAEAQGPGRVSPAKRARLPPRRHELSERNLSILKEEMDSTAANTPPLKRTSSRRSIAPSETDTARSQRSSVPTSVYRHKNLAAFEIHLHAKPPDDIQAAVDRIVNVKISKERQAEVRVIARQFCNSCVDNVRAQSGEDDFVDPLHIALKALGLENLCTHEKADWREELKPVIPRDSHFSSSFMAGVEQLEVADVLAPPRKRQQNSIRRTYITPESSMTQVPTPSPANDSQGSRTMPPPPPAIVEKAGDCCSIKTPRPDISIGIQLTPLVSALSSQSLNKVKARKFLTWLQNEMVEKEPDGPLEPMLIPVPAPRALDLAFPFAVVEGKAYSTGRQIFEAENQAAVSGASALKIQLDLDDLVEHAIESSGAPPTSSKTEPPLFFSICTQGPIHELWVHWTIVEDDVRMFHSKLLDSCNALLLGQGEEFLVKVNNVGRWGTGPFMKSVVERLAMVVKQAKT